MKVSLENFSEIVHRLIFDKILSWSEIHQMPYVELQSLILDYKKRLEEEEEERLRREAQQQQEYEQQMPKFESFTPKSLGEQ